MKGLKDKLTIFTTMKRFNDRRADDMQSGDIDTNTLKQHYHLGQVSTLIDWTTYGSPYKHPYTNTIPPVSKEKAIAMLYDELRSQSFIFFISWSIQKLSC